MSKKSFLISLFTLVSLGLSSQRATLELTFTAIDEAAHVQLDSIKVMNLTQESDTVLYWPDTVLSIYYVGITGLSAEDNTFRVFQNYPNPVINLTTITLNIPEKDRVHITLTDMLGRIINRSERLLDKGIHAYRFLAGGSNYYFFSAQWRGQSSSISILNISSGNQRHGSLWYIGKGQTVPVIKVAGNGQYFSFSPGDELLYIGYAGGAESGMPDSPEENTTSTFRFATNISCPGTPTVEYEGQVYNTIQIFSQCWLKENLNVGIMIDGTVEQSDNGIIEKYCYENNPDNCDQYGGLYQWEEVMQYTNLQGVQGICPPGWHLPADMEWKILEGSVDSQYGIGHPEWDLLDYRGDDAGTNLKSISNWQPGVAGTDLYGFSALPGGYRIAAGSFGNLGYMGVFWTSTVDFNEFSWSHNPSYMDTRMYRFYSEQENGFSIRCLRDE